MTLHVQSVLPCLSSDPQKSRKSLCIFNFVATGLAQNSSITSLRNLKKVSKFCIYVKLYILKSCKHIITSRLAYPLALDLRMTRVLIYDL